MVCTGPASSRVPYNAAFLKQFCLRSVCVCRGLRSKTRRCETVVLGRRAKRRLRFKALYGNSSAFKKCTADVLPPSGVGLAFRSLAFKKKWRFGICVVQPTKNWETRKAPTPTPSALLEKWPVLLNGRCRPYQGPNMALRRGILCQNRQGWGLVVKRLGVFSKDEIRPWENGPFS